MKMLLDIKRTLGLFILFIGMISIQGNAQQEALTTQYMFNGLSINPAYAGFHGTLEMTGIIRTQWVGFDGAPKTQNFGIHGPLKRNKSALGINFMHDQIGVTSTTSFAPSYAYRLQLKKDLLLSFGAQANFANFKSNLTQLSPENPGDATFSSDINSWTVNLGAGAMLFSDKFYVGLSMPNMFKTKYSQDDALGVNQAKVTQHMYLNAGYVFDLGDDFKLKPSTLVRYVAGSYGTIDVNANLYYQHLFGVGVSYRTNESVSALFEWFINDNLIVGYAYDYILSELKIGTSGSHEIMLNYRFPFNNKKVVTPRYF